MSTIGNVNLLSITYFFENLTNVIYRKRGKVEVLKRLIQGDFKAVTTSHSCSITYFIYQTNLTVIGILGRSFSLSIATQKYFLY